MLKWRRALSWQRTAARQMNAWPPAQLNIAEKPSPKQMAFHLQTIPQNFSRTHLAVESSWSRWVAGRFCVSREEEKLVLRVPEGSNFGGLRCC
jgi:hypothetical protein